MKRFTHLLAAMFTCGVMHAQIPNAGFEQWSGGAPVDWASSAPVPGSVEQSTNSHSGSLAVRGNVVDFGGFGIGPFLQAGPDGTGFPVTQRHANLTGYYQFTSTSDDIFIVTVVMIQSGQGIGGGGFVGPATQTGYAQFNAPIFYGAAGDPDTCYVQISISDTTTGLVNSGSYFLVDDLAFEGVNAIGDGAQTPTQFSLFQNYPNPFNPSTTIGFNLPVQEFVSLRVFDLLGREVATLVNEELPLGYREVLWNAQGFSSGVYFCRLEVGMFSETRKLVLLR